jgi:hypothetical protein
MGASRRTHHIFARRRRFLHPGRTPQEAGCAGQPRRGFRSRAGSRFLRFSYCEGRKPTCRSGGASESVASRSPKARRPRVKRSSHPRNNYNDSARPASAPGQLLPWLDPLCQPGCRPDRIGKLGAVRLQAVIAAAGMDETTRNAWCREQGYIRPSWMHAWKATSRRSQAAGVEAKLTTFSFGVADAPTAIRSRRKMKRSAVRYIRGRSAQARLVYLAACIIASD